MKKKFFCILSLMFFTLFFCCNVEAACFRVCDYSADPNGSCSYVDSCEFASCTEVDDKFCGYSGGISKVSCGNLTGIPEKIPELTSFAFTLVQIAVPIILILLGSIDLMKGLTAQKEDEIKKGQKVLVKRIITGVIIFFVVVVVKFLVSIVADSTNSIDIVDCIDCFLSDNCRR